MHNQGTYDGRETSGGWLYVAELVHRIANEYTSAISALRTAAARATSDDAKTVIHETARRLDAFAAAHVLLRPPAVSGEIDLSDYLTRLCRAMALARFKNRPVTLSINAGEPIMADSARCWRVGLIVSELITNAARHAFGLEERAGEIVISIAVRSGQVICEIADSGIWRTTSSPGLGSGLTTSLAADLGGRLVRRTNHSGTSVYLSFPLKTLSSGPATRTVASLASMTSPHVGAFPPILISLSA